MAKGANIAEAVILGGVTLILVYYVITNQDKVKGAINNFLSRANSQLSGGGDNTAGGTATTTTAAPPSTQGDNTSGSDNTPTDATTPSVTATPTPNNTDTNPLTATNPLTSPQNNPQPSSGTPQFTGLTPSGPDVTAIGGPQALNQIAKGPRRFRQTVLPSHGGTIPNVNNPQTNPYVQPPPGNIGQNPNTTTGRNMKQINKVQAPRASNNIPNANCVCTTGSGGTGPRYSGPGCNVIGMTCMLKGVFTRAGLAKSFVTLRS